MRKILNNNRGIALILTVMIVAAIFTLTLHFNTMMRSELYAAYNFQDGIKLEHIARSGFNCGLALLFEDAKTTAVDNGQEAWAHSKDLSALSGSLLDEGRFEVEIHDLAGRIQINRLVADDGQYDPVYQDLFVRLLHMVDPEMGAEEAEDIADAVKDWIDGDGTVTRFGAEESYYQDLDPPVNCRNGPLESLDELLLIKGMKRELFYGTGDHPGISAFLTVYGDETGRININTADPVILLSLSEDMDKNTVEEITAYRENEDNDLSDPGWYKTALGTNEDLIDPGLITVKSSLFEIRSKGIKDAMVKEIIGVVRRDGMKMNILTWKIL
jgi:general secretion pathway protein K